MTENTGQISDAKQGGRKRGGGNAELFFLPKTCHNDVCKSNYYQHEPDFNIRTETIMTWTLNLQSLETCTHILPPCLCKKQPPRPSNYFDELTKAYNMHPSLHHMFPVQRP